MANTQVEIIKYQNVFLCYKRIHEKLKQKDKNPKKHYTVRFDSNIFNQTFIPLLFTTSHN